MAYQKEPSSSNLIFNFLLVGIFLVGLSVAAYFVWYRNQPADDRVITLQPNSEAGKIAQLSNDQFVAGAQTDTPNVIQPDPNDISEEPNEPELSTKPIAVNLPAGWTKTNEVTQPNPCNADLEQTVFTYTNAQETFTIYENGSPTGCDNSVIGDVYYDYDFSSDGKSLVANTTVNPPFCTKDINPTCPKGDGRVTVFVGNGSASNPNVQEKNSVNGKTYYFTMVDSNLESNLDAQGANLAKLVESIQIN